MVDKLEKAEAIIDKVRDLRTLQKEFLQERNQCCLSVRNWRKRSMPLLLITIHHKQSYSDGKIKTMVD